MSLARGRGCQPRLSRSLLLCGVLVPLHDHFFRSFAVWCTDLPSPTWTVNGCNVSRSKCHVVIHDLLGVWIPCQELLLSSLNTRKFACASLPHPWETFAVARSDALLSSQTFRCAPFRLCLTPRGAPKRRVCNCFGAEKTNRSYVRVACSRPANSRNRHYLSAR